MPRILGLIVVTSFLAWGCASVTGPKRVLIGAGAGAGAGAAGGAALSPNSESQALNALVFGLSGALAGGVLALLTDSRPDFVRGSSPLKDQDLSQVSGSKQFLVAPQQELPEFVKERLQPMVIEEYVQKDLVTEEGTLHEPHRVYRIRRFPELFPKPAASPQSAQQKEEQRE